MARVRNALLFALTFGLALPFGVSAQSAAPDPHAADRKMDRKIYPPQAALHRTIGPFSRSPVPV